MDELNLLKHDWNKVKPNEFKTYSEKELFAMTKKKSISIAKWVFIIGLLELLFWIGLDFGLEYLDTILPDNNTEEKETKLSQHSYTYIVASILEIWDDINDAIPYIFIGILIYLNYKIRVEEEPKKLMRNILLMRKSLQYYVRFFLIQFFVISIIILFLMVVDLSYKIEKDTDYLLIMTLFLFIGVFIFIATLFLRFIYHLIYGELIYKLKKNYEELNQIEDQ